MAHLIEFRIGLIADLEMSPKKRLERILIQPGTRALVQLRARVIETSLGPVEIADLHLDDGGVVRGVRYEHFRFVE